MPSHKKIESGAATPEKDIIQKDVRDIKPKSKKSSSMLRNDYDYGTSRGIKTRLKMYPKNISRPPSVQRIEEEPPSYQSSGSTIATVSYHILVILRIVTHLLRSPLIVRDVVPNTEMDPLIELLLY